MHEVAECLTFLADRLINVHGESPDLDYIRKARELAQRRPPRRTSQAVIDLVREQLTTKVSADALALHDLLMQRSFEWRCGSFGLLYVDDDLRIGIDEVLPSLSKRMNLPSERVHGAIAELVAARFDTALEPGEPGFSYAAWLAPVSLLREGHKPVVSLMPGGWYLE